jgi:pyruvate ferredoxin oxidoreductase alpha subunit
MVVTTGYPLTSFKVPYFHNLFHNNSSTATGVVEMIKRFKRSGELPEDVTVIAVSGDGGDDIGMDQLIGAALRNDPFIHFEYDNKGYMNTGAQLCYTGFKGQKASNAHFGPQQAGKTTHHKEIIEILRGTFAPYLATCAESHALDMIRKARKAQATVRAGGFAFVKALSVCPLNWGMDEHVGPSAVEAAVNAACTRSTRSNTGSRTLPWTRRRTARKSRSSRPSRKWARFAHLATPDHAALATEIQTKSIDAGCGYEQCRKVRSCDHGCAQTSVAVKKYLTGQHSIYCSKQYETEVLGWSARASAMEPSFMTRSNRPAICPWG